MLRLWWLVIVLVSALAAPLAQPEIADGGEPASGSRHGTLTGTGVGLCQVTLILGNLTLEGEGDVLVSGRARIEFEGEAGTKAVVDQAQVAEFLGQTWTPPTTGPQAGKPPAKTGQVIYRGFKGTLTLMDNRTTVAVRGTVTNVLAYGMGSACLIGEGTWATAVEGVEGTREGVWQEKPAEPAAAQTKKPALVRIDIGQYKLVRKAKPRPKVGAGG